MTEKAKGVVTKIVPKESKAGKKYWFVTIGGVEFLFFDAKIVDFDQKEIEVEYTIKTDEKGTTFFGNFPGVQRTAGGGAPPKRGTSPEELKQKAIDMKLRTKTMVMSYAKDLVISRNGGALTLNPDEVVKEMDVYIQYMLNKVAGNIKELDG
jgi:hypothetical protein